MSATPEQAAEARRQVKQALRDSLAANDLTGLRQALLVLADVRESLGRSGSFQRWIVQGGAEIDSLLSSEQRRRLVRLGCDEIGFRPSISGAVRLRFIPGDSDPRVERCGLGPSVWLVVSYVWTSRFLERDDNERRRRAEANGSARAGRPGGD